MATCLFRRIPNKGRSGAKGKLHQTAKVEAFYFVPYQPRWLGRPDYHREGRVFKSRSRYYLKRLAKKRQAIFFMAYYTYILYSSKLDRYYTGSTADIEKRLVRHNAGATKSTKPGRPWKLVYSEEYPTRAEAVQRENYIKRQKSRAFILSLINQDG